MDKQLLAVLLLLGFVACASGHMSIFVPSMWGSEPWNINSNWAVIPLEDLDFVDWWFHGLRSLNDSPPATAITQLPAGGVIDFEITGNKAFTSMGRGLWVKPGATPRWIPDPWSNDMGGGSSNIHAPHHADVAGCALGIAYKSDVKDVQPEDFVIMSVVHDCISRQLQAFDIPALPACPNNKCICSWFWIHNSTGGSDQMYMTGFQCDVSNPSKRVIGKPSAPVRCDGKPPCYLYPKWGNSTSSCKNTLNPLYWGNNQGNNIDNPTNIQCAPTYNTYYGFPDGAQNQIFDDDISPPAGYIGDTLPSGSSLSSSSGSILASPSYYTKLVVQSNGNVEVVDLRTGEVHWSTNTAGKGSGSYKLTLGYDGNLVLTDSQSSTLWTSNSANLPGSFPPYRLKLRDLLSLSIVDSNSTPLWNATMTA